MISRVLEDAWRHGGAIKSSLKPTVTHELAAPNERCKKWAFLDMEVVCITSLIGSSYKVACFCCSLVETLVMIVCVGCFLWFCLFVSWAFTRNSSSCILLFARQGRFTWLWPSGLLGGNTAEHRSTSQWQGMGKGGTWCLEFTPGSTVLWAVLWTSASHLLDIREREVRGSGSKMGPICLGCVCLGGRVPQLELCKWSNSLSGG